MTMRDFNCIRFCFVYFYYIDKDNIFIVNDIMKTMDQFIWLG